MLTLSRYFAEGDLGFAASGSYVTAGGQSLEVRHYVGATFTQPSFLDLPYNYSVIGNYTFSVTVQNSLGSATNSSIIATQVIDLSMALDQNTHLDQNI